MHNVLSTPVATLLDRPGLSSEEIFINESFS